MEKQKVTILYDAVEDQHQEEAKSRGEKLTPLVCEEIERVLAKRGHSVSRLAAVSDPIAFINQLAKDRGEVIFNVCESLDGVNQQEQNVAAVLELIRRPYTGTPAIGLSLAQDKALTKKILQFHGIRTPKFMDPAEGAMTAVRDPVDPVPTRNGDARSAEELERDLKRIRSQMDHTLNLIEDRLSPHRLIDRALDHLHGGPGLFASNLGRTIRRHPVPTAMFAAGLAWLLLAERGDKIERPYRRSGGDRAPYHLREASSLSGTSPPPQSHFEGEENMSGNWDQSRGNRRGLQDRFSSTLEDTRDRIGQVGSIAQHQVDRARTGFEQMLEEQPLVLGAVAIALGAVLGATLPTTRIENRYLGPSRDNLQDRVGEYARDQWERAKSVVSSAGTAAVEQAEKEGIMMRLHGNWLLRLCLAPLSLMLAPGLAAAQIVESMPMEQVKECICQEQQIKTLSDRLGTSSGAYSQRQKELQDTEQQLADLQRTAQPGDPDAVTKAEALVDRRNLLRDQLRDEFPGYNKMIADYNQRVERYNATCTKQPMLSFDIVTAKENLSCPNP